jgi:hypothetical protein
MKLNIADELNQQLYPLSWFVNQFNGSGKLGGHFGIPDSEFISNAHWAPNANELEYTLELTTPAGQIVQEQGVWEVLTDQPEQLQSSGQFAISAEITTTWTNPSSATSNTLPSWRTKYVGLVGNGRAELLSDRIELLNVEHALGNYHVNDLWRSRRIYGMVKSELFWAWDIAIIGNQPEMLSLVAGTMRENLGARI